MADHYVWLFWASAFLIPWALLFVAVAPHRRVMLWASFGTVPFGLTEPLFVPSYWNPPSLFDLAQATGFDIESLIFSFGIGGVGAVLYNIVTRQYLSLVPRGFRRLARHRHHRLALATPFLVFGPLYLLPWNPIYAAVIAMAVGAVATAVCRPDLAVKTWIGSGLFLIYYTVFLLGLEWSAPGYVARVWNVAALSGVFLWRIPIEELLFAASFGAYWSGVYEHLTWMRTAAGAFPRSA